MLPIDSYSCIVYVLINVRLITVEAAVPPCVQVLCLLPSEPRPLHASGVPAEFVGHPVIEDCLDMGLFQR